MSNPKTKEKNCEYNNFKRARYFHGMLMTDRDFRDEQIYHNEKRKLLNRTLHGWGVVCGLKVKPTNPESSKIIIETGLALDCAGNEIFLCEPFELDVIELIKPCTTRKKKSQKECTEESEQSEQENKWYIIIKYNEVPTDPVPVYAPGGGCEEKVCDYARTREGYCIELCHAQDSQCPGVPCPEKLRENEGPCETLKDKPNEIREFLCETLLVPCPGSCCEDHGVVLGSITFEGEINPDTTIETLMINNWDCRRYVITFNLLQHWMTELAPLKVPFEAIADYAHLATGCIDHGSAVEAFEDMCREEGEDEKVKVPNVVKMRIGKAENVLKKVTLIVGKIEYKESKPAGIVLEQKPKAGEEVIIDSPVDLWVSKSFEMDITDIKGIADKSAEKLSEKGIKTIKDLAEAKPEVVADALGISVENAESFIKQAKEMLKR